MRTTRWFPFPVLLLFVACGARGGEPSGEALLLSELQTSPGSSCIVSSSPAELPSADSLVEGGSLSDEIRQLGHEHELGPSHAVFSLSFTSEGGRVRRDLIEHSFPDTVAGRVRDITFASMRDLTKIDDDESGAEPGLELGARRDWGVRLRVDYAGMPDGEVRLEVGRQEYCPPRPRDPNLENQLAGLVAAGPRYRDGRRERVVLMAVLVHPHGFVVGAEVAQGEARGSTLERRLRDHMRQFAFHPATVDGIPTYGTIQIPIRIPG